MENFIINCDVHEKKDQVPEKCILKNEVKSIKFVIYDHFLSYVLVFNTTKVNA